MQIQNPCCCMTLSGVMAPTRCFICGGPRQQAGTGLEIIRLHRVPSLESQPETHAKWCQVLGVHKDKLPNAAVVCSLHFNHSSFKNVNQRLLQQDAVPFLQVNEVVQGLAALQERGAGALPDDARATEGGLAGRSVTGRAAEEGPATLTAKAVAANNISADDHPLRYDLEAYEHRCYAVVMHWHSFAQSGRREWHYRHTNADRQQVHDMLESLDIQYSSHLNLKEAQLRTVLASESRKDFSDYGSLLVIASSHGLEGSMFMASDGEVPISTFWEPFEDVTTLHGKPKIFIIQACRGGLDDKKDDTVVVHSKQSAVRALPSSIGGNFHAAPWVNPPWTTDLPRQQDILLVFGAPSGYMTYSLQDGTLLLKHFCDVLLADPTVSLTTILQELTRTVVSNLNVEDEDEETITSQTPTIFSTLTGAVHLCEPHTPSLQPAIMQYGLPHEQLGHCAVYKRAASDPRATYLLRNTFEGIGLTVSEHVILNLRAAVREIGDEAQQPHLSQKNVFCVVILLPGEERALHEAETHWIRRALSAANAPMLARRPKVIISINLPDLQAVQPSTSGVQKRSVGPKPAPGCSSGLQPRSVISAPGPASASDHHQHSESSASGPSSSGLQELQLRAKTRVAAADMDAGPSGATKKHCGNAAVGAARCPRQPHSHVDVTENSDIAFICGSGIDYVQSLCAALTALPGSGRGLLEVVTELQGAAPPPREVPHHHESSLRYALVLPALKKM